MKKLLPFAAVVLATYVSVGCGEDSKVAVNTTPTLAVITATVDPEEPCPRTGVEGTVTIAEGDRWVINCAPASGMIVAGIREASNLSDYRSIKEEVDQTLCQMWSQDLIDSRVSWAPPTPGDLALTTADVHTQCSVGK